jgi:LEA14-like dessication related protein
MTMTSLGLPGKKEFWSRNLQGLGLALVLGLLAATSLSGCGVRELARGEIQPPKVTVQGVTLGVPTTQGWPLSCTLQLENPNARPLTVLGYDYDLAVEGRSVAQGASNETVALPALGQTVVEFPVFVKIPALMGLAPSLLRPEQKLRYQISGGVRLASLLGGLRVPFRFQGELNPKEALEHFRPYLQQFQR